MAAIAIRDDSLRDPIAGEVHPHCRGIGTYPDDGDERSRALHAACLRLEARGLIRRVEEIPASCLGPREVVWEAAGAGDD